MDREKQSRYDLVIKATEDCFSPLPSETSFDPLDDTLLKVTVFINDINDNPPRFTHPIFTGGITTNSDFGYEILKLEVNVHLILFETQFNGYLPFYFIRNLNTLPLLEDVKATFILKVRETPML